jgi:hypothetical protein
MEQRSMINKKNQEIELKGATLLYFYLEFKTIIAINVNEKMAHLTGKQHVIKLANN